MAKKSWKIIEYRYDKMDAWIEYARTQVPTIVDHYYLNCSLENPGAEVRIRSL
jgi:hypothetical protein